MTNFKDIFKKSIKNNSTEIKKYNAITIDTIDTIDTINNNQKTIIQYLQELSEEEFTKLYNIYMKPIKNLHTLDYW